MELSGVHVVLPNGRGEFFPIIRACRDDRDIHGTREKTVHEINVTVRGNVAKERAIGLDDFELIPADLRDFQAIGFGKAHDFALKDSQTGGATVELFTLLEQRLVTDTNAEERLATLNEVAGGLDQLLALHRVHAIIECAHAGQHRGAGMLQAMRRGETLDVSAKKPQRLLDAMQITRAIIDQCNHARSVRAVVGKFNRSTNSQLRPTTSETSEIASASIWFCVRALDL
jgi:hypothetical protein